MTMMLGALRPLQVAYDNLDPVQAASFDAIAAGPRGAVEGPLRVLVLNPALADPVQNLGAYCRFGTSLPPRLAELAIIIVGAFWQAGFEWEAHAPLAERAGIDKDVIEAIRRRDEPPFIRNDEQVVHDALRALLDQRDIPDSDYTKLIDEIGQEGAIDLVGIAGYYCLISLVINAFRVPLSHPSFTPFGSRPVRP